MAIPLLGVGSVTKLTQNVVYACPARSCYTYTQGTTPDQSNDGITWSGYFDPNLSAAFLRSTGTDTIISIKAI